MKVLLAHPQTQHSYKIASILYKNELLLKFYTSFTFPRKNEKFIPLLVRNYISNRIIDIPPTFVNSNYTLEIERAITNKILKLNYYDNYFRLNEKFQTKISLEDIKKSNLVIGFDSASWLLCKKVQKLNKPFILDQTSVQSVFRKRLFEKYKLKYPEWSNEFVCNKSNSHLELEKKELNNADVISVGCQFIKNNLLEIGVEESKIIINPYGIDMGYFTPKIHLSKHEIRFLFFGTISANKGIPTLLNAWKKIQNKGAKLVLAGYGALPSHVNLPSNVEVVGKILPNQRKELFDDSHVLVFPSLYEGFGQVLIEASSSGLPLISTYNTGAVELIEEGVNGFLIQPGDEDALAARMEYFIENPDRIKEMGNSRLHQIREKFSLVAYEKRWLDLIGKF